jgi:hypothetical protein
MVAAAAIGFLVARQVAGTRHSFDEGAEAPSAVPVSVKSNVAAETTDGDAPTAPMPPENTPLAQTFDALSARARHGDVAAMERLLRGLTRCENQSSIGYRPYDEVDPNATRSQAELAELHAEFESARVFCDGVVARHYDDLPEWLERAAEAGDAEAMFCYAVESPMRRARTTSPAWLDLRRRYIAHARDYAERAFAQGYVTAAWTLYASYADAQPGIPDWYAIPPGTPDRERAYAFARLQADRLRNMPALRAGIAANWADRADLLAAQLSADQRARGEAFARQHAAATPPPARGLCISASRLP